MRLRLKAKARLQLLLLVLREIRFQEHFRFEELMRDLNLRKLQDFLKIW